MPQRLVSLLARYGCAVVSIVLAVVLRFLLDPVLGLQFPFVTILLAILVTAWYGGFRPALAAVMLGAVALEFFLLPPRWDFRLAGSGEVIALVLYVLTGLGIAALAGYMHAAQRALRDANAMLEGRVRERTRELTDANEKLRVSEELSRLTVQGITSHAVFTLDPTGIVTSWNPGAARMKGYDAKEIVGQTFSRFYTPEDVDSGKPARELQIAEEDGCFKEEGLRVRKDGSRFWASVTIMPIYDHGPQPIGFVKVTQDITERRLASEALRDRERLLEIATGSARVGLVVVEAGYQYLFANATYGEIFGLSTQDIVGLRVPDVLHEGWPQIQPRLDRALGGEQVSYEMVLPPRTDAQGTRHYAVTYEPRMGNKGERSVVVVVVDVTQQKQNEEALLASEERLRLMIEAVNDHAIFMLDPSGNILTWNRGAEQIDGYTADEIVGRHYSCLFTPDSIASGLPQRELELAAAEGRAHVEGWRVRKNGSRFWANGTLAALYDSNHSVKGYSKITRDLTVKRHNDELLRSVLNHTIDAIVSIDERGTVAMINQAGERLFGRESSEVVGQNISLLMPEPYRHEHEVIGIGREVRGLRKDGTTFPLELAVTEFRLDDQRQYVGILRDISEKKLLEAQFRQSQKMEVFGQLAGGVAHDFNNLLAVIIGNLDFLRSEMITPNERDLIDSALHAANRGAELTHRLLAFARKQELDPKRVALNSFVRDVVGLVRRTIGEDIEIVTQLEPAVDGVEVDPGQLENALLNLAVNARDAMPDGGKLTISTHVAQLDAGYVKRHPGTAPGNYQVVSVTDTGCGMTNDILAKAFDPFFTTKEVGKGTGLGLSMVYGFIKQSGGHAAIYSDVNQGTTVSLYLPRALGLGGVTTRQAVQQPSRPGSDQHILLVEDDRAVRTMVERQLSSMGYRVKAAENGREALEYLLLNDDIDLLLTDVVMPGGMSGFDLAMAARRSRPQLHVLLMSGYADGGNASAGIRAKQMSIIGKPFTRTGLADAISRTLESADSD